jgi:hypothetical protein
MDTEMEKGETERKNGEVRKQKRMEWRDGEGKKELWIFRAQLRKSI